MAALIPFALEEAPEIEQQVESTLRELAHEFGFTRQEDFKGFYLFLLSLYAFVYPTAHNLSVLIRQAQLYLDQLGGDIKQAETDVKKGLTETKNTFLLGPELGGIP